MEAREAAAAALETGTETPGAAESGETAGEEAGIGTVVFGTDIPTLVRQGWSQIDIRAEEVVRRTPFADCRLVGGVLRDECDALFAGKEAP